VEAQPQPSDFFFYFNLFNHYSRNELVKHFFSNLVIFSHARETGVTYKEVQRWEATEEGRRQRLSVREREKEKRKKPTRVLNTN
jgi:hypothetical protein